MTDDLSIEELKDKLKEKKKTKKNPFNKKIVTLIVWMNIIFTIVVAYLFYKTGNEPSTLIEKWFHFTGVELVALAGIKVVDTLKDAISIWKGVRGNE